MENKVVFINMIEWATDIASICIDEFEIQTGKRYTQDDPDDPDTVIYTEEGQEIFDDIYDQVRELLSKKLKIDQYPETIKLIKPE